MENIKKREQEGFQSLQREIDRLEKEVEIKNNETTYIKKEVDDKKREISEIHERINETEARLNAEKARLEAELRNRENERASFENQRAEYLKRLDEKDAEMRVLRDRVSNVSEDERRKTEDKLRSEIAKAVDEEKKRAEAYMKAEMERVTKDREVLKIEIQSMKEGMRVEQKSTELIKANEISVWERKLQLRESEMAGLQKQLEEIQNQLTYEHSLKDTSVKNQNTEAERWETAKKELESKIMQAENEKTLMNEKMQKMQAQIDEVEKRSYEKNQEALSLKEELARVKRSAVTQPKTNPVTGAGVIIKTGYDEKAGRKSETAKPRGFFGRLWHGLNEPVIEIGKKDENKKKE